MNISCRIANADTQCGRITNPPERAKSMDRLYKYIGVVLLVLLGKVSPIAAQDSLVLVRENAAHAFGETIPAGNYSGIVNVEGNTYALVSDKGTRGEVVFVNIEFDNETGDIINARHIYSLPTGESNPDNEDIVYLKDKKAFYIASEEDNNVREFVIDKVADDGTIKPTGNILPFGDHKGKTRPNRGLESLAYDSIGKVFWTTTECPLVGDGEVTTSNNGVRQQLRLMATDGTGGLSHYAYQMDTPEEAPEMDTFLMGVSALTALGNGHLLVLEREVHIPQEYLGAFSLMKIYAVDVTGEQKVPVAEPLTESSPFVKKRLVCQWRTDISLFDFGFANYEGMCLGPRLEDGSQVVVLVSDSQNQYGGVLSDWFKTIVVR